MKKKVKDLGPYLVDEKNRGDLSDTSEGVVMDNTISRNPDHHNKPKVNYFVTENLSLLAGNSTVALFKITKRHAVNMTP